MLWTSLRRAWTKPQRDGIAEAEAQFIVRASRIIESIVADEKAFYINMTL